MIDHKLDNNSTFQSLGRSRAYTLVGALLRQLQRVLFFDCSMQKIVVVVAAAVSVETEKNTL
jgi:sulfite exporter TauE/SafE